MPKIMIVEDDAAIREELALLLDNEGYQTAAVTQFSAVQKSMILPASESPPKPC